MEKKVYLPGDELPKGTRYNPAIARREGGKVYTTVVGTVEKGTFVPYEMAYVPQGGETIIGVIYDKKPSAYFVDTATAYNGLLLSRELRSTSLDVGDVISAKISRIEGTDFILSYPRVLRGGKILRVPSSKVPRIIGKGASMVNLIKELTNTEIFVGANGYIWIKGENVDKAIKAIHYIVRRAHLHGLTDDIKAMLESGKKGKAKPKREKPSLEGQAPSRKAQKARREQPNEGGETA